jgi:hypothetical protein
MLPVSVAWKYGEAFRKPGLKPLCHLCVFDGREDA